MENFEFGWLKKSGRALGQGRHHSREIKRAFKNLNLQRALKTKGKYAQRRAVSAIIGSFGPRMKLTLEDVDLVIAEWKTRIP